MATERFHNLAPEKKANILNAAMTEFSAAGFAKGKLENVAKTAGVTKGLLYYYFEDRQDLIQTLYAEVEARMAPIMGPIPKKSDPEQFWQGIEGVYRSVIHMASGDPILLSFLVRVLSELGSGITPPGFEKHMKNTMAGMMEAVNAGQQCGAIRTDLPPTLLLMGVMNLMRAGDQWIVMEAKAGKLNPDSATAILRLYRSALGTPQGAASSAMKPKGKALKKGK